MREVHIKPRAGELISEPLPAVGRLQRDMRLIGVTERIGERLPAGRDPLLRDLAVLADDRDLRTTAMPIDADPTRSVSHRRSSPRIARPRGCNPRGLQRRFGAEDRLPATPHHSAVRVTAARALHGINGWGSGGGDGDGEVLL